MRIRAALLCGAIALSLVPGCMGGVPDRPEPPETLRVFDEDEQRFRTELQPYLAAEYPELQVELLPYESFASGLKSAGAADEEAILYAFLEAHAPDLIVARSAAAFRSLQRNLWLAPLNRFMAESDFAADPIGDALLEGLRGEDGLLYAWAPSFDARALYFNAAAFREAGVPAPVDGMTWAETLLRAEAVADGRSAARFGLFHEGAPTPYSFILELGARGGARFAEDGRARPALRSDAWRAAWETAADAFRSGAVYGAHRLEGEPADPAAMFADGRLAMMLGGVTLADRIAGLGAEWGTVTEPVDPARPGVSQSFRYSAYLAVPNNGAQPDFAWEVVRFLAEGPLAEGGGGIPLDQAAFKRKYGEADVSAFARLRPAAAADAAADPNAGLSAEFFATLFVEGNRLADAVVGGGMPVDRAFDEWAGIGEALLLP